MQRSVWAPRARRVEYVIDGRLVSAVARDGGWWDSPLVEPGRHYAISLDGGPPRPDPRSVSQPEGVHGPSCWIDLGAMGPAPTMKPAPVALRDAVIYELHVGTFTEGGTFESAIAQLDHLAALGVTHVELMPVAQFSGGHGWGYDGVDLFAAHTPYGGPRGLRELIAQCHARGLAVLVDTVLNHFGPDGAYVFEFGPYRTDRYKTPWGDAVNLDGEGSREVRRFLIDSALTWLRDYGADGLRLDAVHSLYDASERHLIAELVDEVRALEKTLGRPLVLIGEYDEHDPNVVTERARGGWGLDAHWDDDFHHAVHALVTNETNGYYADFADRDALRGIVERGYWLDGRLSGFRGGPHGKPYGVLPRDRLVAYVQSHDQIGNRAAGERLHELAGVKRAMIAAGLLFASPFVPMLFQGEEWAASTPFCYFAQPESADLANAIREGRRKEHAASGWTSAPIDPIDPATRDRCVLRWPERDTGDHRKMLAWYRSLITARRAHPGLRDGAPSSARLVRDGDVLRLERGRLALVCNLSEQALQADLGGEVVTATEGLASNRELPPLSCALVAG
ncbi:MAG: malto-oligosyltrehalose trehalohydrolase [Kofleriaceae bacterium]|nr:malto-oligosyltrehalose trehalohydrolase [Kofleriaceae bacterium]